MNAVEICQDLVVPKPQNAIALALQELGSRGFPVRRTIVSATIHFDDQPGLVADKISNVAADRHLAAKPVALHLARAQYLPDPPLGLGHVVPQSTSARMCAVDRMLLHFWIGLAAARITPSQPPPSRGRGGVLDLKNNVHRDAPGMPIYQHLE